MLLAVTRPRLPRTRGLLAGAPTAAELRPRWAALAARAQLSAAAKLLALAQAEPPGLMHVATRAVAAFQAAAARFTAWGRRGPPGVCASCAPAPAPAAVLCPACAWPSLLLAAGALVDRLASLEAVVGDVMGHLLGDPRAAALMAVQGAPPGQLAGQVRAAVDAGGRVLRAVAARLERAAPRSSEGTGGESWEPPVVSQPTAGGTLGEDPTTPGSLSLGASLREVKVEGPGAGTEGGRGGEGCAEACDELMNEAR